MTVLRVWLFKKWFEQVAHVYEFGCGTAHNLVAFAKLAPDKTLHGLDWSSASQQIIRLLAEHHGFDISGGVFDLLSPDPSYEIAPNSGVLTVGALEQLGREYEPFVEFLLQRAPTICVHIETLYEAYDQDRLFDNVAVRYLQKRGYLQGYVSRLRQLQKEGYIKILQLQRTFGSLYHDGYSFLVWEPVR